MADQPDLPAVGRRTNIGEVQQILVITSRQTELRPAETQNERGRCNVQGHAEVTNEHTMLRNVSRFLRLRLEFT